MPVNLTQTQEWLKHLNAVKHWPRKHGRWSGAPHGKRALTARRRLATPVHMRGQRSEPPALCADVRAALVPAACHTHHGRLSSWRAFRKPAVWHPVLQEHRSEVPLATQQAVAEQDAGRLPPSPADHGAPRMPQGPSGPAAGDIPEWTSSQGQWPCMTSTATWDWRRGLRGKNKMYEKYNLWKEQTLRLFKNHRHRNLWRLQSTLQRYVSSESRAWMAFRWSELALLVLDLVSTR